MHIGLHSFLETYAIIITRIQIIIIYYGYYNCPACVYTSDSNGLAIGGFCYTCCVHYSTEQSLQETCRASGRKNVVVGQLGTNARHIDNLTYCLFTKHLNTFAIGSACHLYCYAIISLLPMRQGELE